MRGSLQIKNNRYYAVFRINGKQKWVSLKIEAKRGNKKKAEQALNELMLKYQNNPHLINKILFVEYAQKWLDSVKGHVDSITYESYKQHVLKHFIPYFKPLNIYLQDIDISHIEQYYNYKSVSGRLDGKNGGLSHATIKRHSIVLNLIFKRAMYEQLITRNPCEYAKVPTAKTTVKKIEFYTTEQCNKLLSITNGTELYNMIYLTFIYGLRRSELMGLRWCDIDFNNETITIQHTAVTNGIVERKDKTKTSSSNRVYPLLSDIKKILLSIQQQQAEYKDLFGNCYINSGYVFTRENGEAYFPDYPSKKLQKVIKENKLPHIRWHDLRHSCVCMLIARGWHMKDISEWLGHSDISTTMNIYGHISIEHKREIAKELNGLLES